ncbi:MAG: lipopolysaccharide biosynthesis protein [Alistipes sp.]|nr:lipopolysaccharide biosynthesis protein [Alistipes sp.]
MSVARSNSAAKGFAWAAVDKFGIVLLQFVINLVLARLLVPEDFGLVGMILIIVAVSSILADGGFGAALIQKLNPKEADFSTAFCVNITMALLLYAFIYIFAPSISQFLGAPILKDFLRVLSLVIVINAVGLVSKVMLRRALAFKQIAISNLCAYILAAAVAIVMSIKGCGAWSLVAIHIVNAIFANLFICLSARWIPREKPSFSSLKQMFAYGEFMLASDILDNICFNIQNTIVGKYFSPYAAGQYAQAKKMSEVAYITLPSALNQVLFSVFSGLQCNIEELREKLRLNMKMTAFVIFPLLTILIIIAKPLILLLFGANWSDSAIYFQVLCVGGFFAALQYFNYSAVASIGKSKVLFITSIYKTVFLIASLVIGANISMAGVLVAMVLSSANMYFTNALLARKYIGYRFSQQMKDLLPTALCALSSGIAIYSIYSLLCLNWVVCVVLFAALYLFASYIFKLDILNNVSTIVARLLPKKLLDIVVKK